MINMQLANRLGIPDKDVKTIILLQDRRKYLGTLYLSRTISSEDYQKSWTENEYALQELWGFPKDARYHKFWEMEGCRCPKMDNEDAYPTGYYTRVEHCPLHGVHTWK